MGVQSRQVERSAQRRASTNGWTGGQYSLYRVVLATALVALVWLPMPTTELCGWLPFSGQLTMSDRLRIPLTAIAVCIGAGFFGRWFAAAALVAAFCLGRAYAWWLLQPLLLAHVLTTPAPFGSLLAVQRPDPDGGWSRSVWNLGLATLAVTSSVASAFVSMALSGAHSIERETAWAIVWSAALIWMALAARSVLVQRFTWCAWVVYVAIVALRDGPSSWWIPAAAVTLGTFDPALVPPRRARDPEVVYYDGDCGLCHRTVRFLLAEDREGAAFLYAALQSEHFAEHVGDAERAGLGDSVIVRTADGRLLQRSSAVVHLLVALGGLWRILGSLLWCVPRPLRDLGYDGVARVRKRVFPAPEGLCPMIPPELGRRFLG